MADNPRIDELRRRLEKEPGSRLFAQLAEELRKGGELGEAIDVSRAGLEKHPNYPSARMTLGRALLDSGDLQAARGEFDGVLKAAPDNILASRLLGECLEGLGDWTAAIARYKATLALAPGDKQVAARLQLVEVKAKTPAPPMAPAAAAVPAAAPEAPPTLAAVDLSAPIPLVAAEENFELEDPHAVPQAAVMAAPVPADTLAPEPPAATVPPMLAPVLAPAPTAQAIATSEFEAHGFEFDAGTLPPTPAPAPERVAELAPAPAAAEAAPEPVEPTPEIASQTLADLYFSQGHTAKAIEVLSQVAGREPSNERAKARLQELLALERHLEEQEQVGAAAPAADPRAARRAAIERTIAKLEGLLAAARKG